MTELTNSQIEALIRVKESKGYNFNELANSKEWQTITNRAKAVSGSKLANLLRPYMQGDNSSPQNKRKNYPTNINQGVKHNLSDAEIFAIHNADNVQPREVASMFGYNPDSVRGRLSRAARETEGHRASLERVITRESDTAQRHIDNLINRHRANFAERRHELNRAESEIRLLFVSDIHAPFCRLDALELVYKIAERFNPHWITADNDDIDLKYIGSRHDDETMYREMAWENNIRNLQDWLRVHRGALLQFAPAARDGGLFQVPSNHTKRFYRFFANMGMTNIIYDWLVFNESINTTMLSAHHTVEGIIKITNGLKVIHGANTSSNEKTVARAMLDLTRGEKKDGEEGIYYHVIGGHTHRPFKVEMNGVTATTAPALCTLVPSWIPNPPKNWKLGVAIAICDPRGRDVHTQNIIFEEEGEELVAYWPSGDFKYERIAVPIHRDMQYSF